MSASETPASAPRGPADPRTCLVVDDSAVIRKVARCILEGLGYRVREAVDGAEALAACAESMPDAILLDGSMPNVDGYAFLQALRPSPGGEAPRVVFCTAENDVGALTRALRAGANDFLLKPFDRGLLTAKLEPSGLAAEAA